MRRHCDGTDPNLTREIQQWQFDQPVMTVATAWQWAANPGHVIIQCQCGKIFDDVNHMVTYPHEEI